jgi:exosortase
MNASEAKANNDQRVKKEPMLSGTRQESFTKFLRLPAFVIFVAVSLVLWWNALASTFALASQDEEYTHLLLIVPISVALLLLDWRPPESSSRTSLLAAFLMVLALLVNLTANSNSFSLPADWQLTIKMFSLVIWWGAAFAACFGVAAFLRQIFPLLFLFWTIPPPDSWIDWTIRMLQHTSAAAAHVLFWLVLVPVEQRGLFIHIPNLTLQVAPECSSIRSSLILVVTTMVLAHLLLNSPVRKFLLIAASIPLAIAKNGLRIFVLGYLAIHGHPNILTSRLHRQGGIIFFLIALGATALLLWILRKGEIREERN